MSLPMAAAISLIGLRSRYGKALWLALGRETRHAGLEKQVGSTRLSWAVPDDDRIFVGGTLTFELLDERLKGGKTAAAMTPLPSGGLRQVVSYGCAACLDGCPVAGLPRAHPR
jgi:hypothetical protein